MKKLLIIVALFVASSAFANSSDTIKKQKLVVDGLNFSGVTQVQWQVAQTKGGGGFAQWGNFEDGTNSRVDVRRARLKMVYKHDFITTAFQINASTVAVSVVEANLNIATRSKVASLTTGVFYKPYGYMVQRAATIRMQPELPRIIQVILPSEIALGGYATFTGEKNTVMNKFKLDFGIITKDEFVSGNKQLNNFIARLDFAQPMGENSFVGAVFTTYFGGVKGSGEYKFDKNAKSYIFNNDIVKAYGRNYYDLGLKFETKTAWGDTKIIGEYMFGTQPGTAFSSHTINGDYSMVYNRKFTGGYIYFQQQIASSKLSFASMLDYYDPNREIKAKDISHGNGFSAADIAYTTLGVGLYYNLYKDMMTIMAYYDFVWNEKSDVIPGFNKNIKDNVFTLRLQCAF